MKKILHGHPFLYYTREDLAQVQGRVENDPAFAARYEALKAKGEAILHKHPVSYTHLTLPTKA